MRGLGWNLIVAGSTCSFAQLWLWSAERVSMTFLSLLAVWFLAREEERRAVLYWPDTFVPEKKNECFCNILIWAWSAFGTQRDGPWYGIPCFVWPGGVSPHPPAVPLPGVRWKLTLFWPNPGHWSLCLFMPKQNRLGHKSDTASAQFDLWWHI